MSLTCEVHSFNEQPETCQLCEYYNDFRNMLAGLGLSAAPGEDSCRCCGPNRWMEPPCQNPDCERNQNLRALRAQRRYDPEFNDGPRRIYCIMTQQQQARVREYESSLPDQRLEVRGTLLPPSAGMTGRDILHWEQYWRQVLEWGVLQELRDHDDSMELSLLAALGSYDGSYNGDTGPRDRACERLRAGGWLPVPPRTISRFDLLRVRLWETHPETYLHFIEEYGDTEISPSVIAGMHAMRGQGPGGPITCTAEKSEAPVRTQRLHPCVCEFADLEISQGGLPPRADNPAATAQPERHFWEPYLRQWRRTIRLGTVRVFSPGTYGFEDWPKPHRRPRVAPDGPYIPSLSRLELTPLDGDADAPSS
ncbi:uncharacterized protein BP01DRAFT_378831 [Aspergillus saccharolyticus JOP 1030-1]|uniref:Uncharacterized protein n=1 Tax=Aspergillus saccharolyticus JOP 1030-1 TaxID=1450539 RepID=A0A318ZRG9_9EURO|nr:hypothetical protein BP01DRAFT_378831 [Aspergillus saccharolyticus JOP 1030-1]PYH49265.1 hypothetical protein BP01DRAFT_378831 [Aspergillus saccharolyticus JOP 1030-1]